jgi:putative transposase
MPRTARVDVGEQVYHVINRANGRLQIFNSPDDYLLFEHLLAETVKLTGMRLLSYTLMPNHWHLLLWPRNDGDLREFMHQLSNSHTRQVHAETGTNGSGHLYQGRYKSFLVDSDSYMLTVMKYIERNPARAGLVRRAEEWQWGSAWRRVRGTAGQKSLLTAGPTDLPADYLSWLNEVEEDANLTAIRESVNKSRPYGRETWVEKMIRDYKLESTLRAPGRPRAP